MRIRTSPRRLMTVIPLLAAPVLLGAWASPGTSPSIRLDQAIHDTDTVRTLVHTDTILSQAPAEKVTITTRGEEDEVRNRERDQESVTVLLGTKKIRKLTYTLHLIFLNGKTYYQTSQLGKQWHTRKGMTFPDAFLGGWKRGRTKVTLPKKPHFVAVGSVANGLQHMRSPFRTAGSAGKVDLWYTTAKTPYVVKEQILSRATSGRKASSLMTTNFGSFNQTLVIEPPSSGGGSA